MRGSTPSAARFLVLGVATVGVAALGADTRLDTEVKVTWTAQRKFDSKQERGQVSVDENLTITFVATSHATAPAGTRPWALQTTAEPEDIKLTVTGTGKSVCTGKVDEESGSRTITNSWTWTAKKKPGRSALFKREGHALVVTPPHLNAFELTVQSSAPVPGRDPATAMVAMGCALLTMPMGNALATMAQSEVEANAVLKKDTSFFGKLRAELDDPKGSFTRTGRADHTHSPPAKDGVAVSSTFSVDFTVRVNPAPSDVEAEPGPSKEAVRAAAVELDGSRSRGKNLTYTWTFSPLSDCPDGASFEGVALHGPKVRFRVLCGLKATLKVSDGTRDSTRSTEVIVTPRTGAAWTTTVTHESDWGTKPPWPQPYLEVLDGGHARGKHFLLGENWCGYDHGTVPRGVESIGAVHPHGKRLFGDWRGHGWTEEKLADPGGPFDGWYFVKSAEQLDLKRVGVFNVQLHEDGPVPRGHVDTWRAYNGKKLGRAGLKKALDSLMAHEGLGDGRPGSGHSSIMRDVVSDPEHDPRAAIEGRIDRDLSSLMVQIEEELTRINTLLGERSGVLDESNANDPTSGVSAFFPDEGKRDGGGAWYDYGMGAP